MNTLENVSHADHIDYTGSLTFETLRRANLARLPLFKNHQGQVVHVRDGSDWSDAQWVMALVGEVGELANLLKKAQRGDFIPDLNRDIEHELADIQIYLDLLAFRLGVNLGSATIRKFNEVSHRVGVPTRIINGNQWTEI
jgi:NTP pyrophosphatase (non-canonical NTP hydrolase)